MLQGLPMSSTPNLFETRRKFDLGNGRQGTFYSLPALEKAGVGPVSKLPVSHPARARIGAAQLRRQEGHRGERARSSPTGSPRRRAREEIPFVVARIVLQDFTGVPLLVDLAAMRRPSPAHGQESQDHRAAGAGGSGGGPLGAGGLLRYARMRSTATWRSNSSATASATSS